MILYSISMNKMSQDANGLIWHYTDANGLIGILSSNSFWASSTLFMNDVTELRLGTEAVQSYIDVHANSLRPRTQRAFRDWNRFAKEADGRILHTFLFCASRCGDSLAMWRGYAAGSGGFAIGIDPEHVFTNKNPDRWETDLPWLSVEYDDQGYMRLIEDLARSLEGKPDLGESEIAASMYSSMDEFEIETTVHRIKDRAFRDENEVRLIVPARDSNISQIKHRAGVFGVVPYVDITAGSDSSSGERVKNLPITHVRIGPTRYPEQSILSVRSLLAAKGYRGVKTSLSEAPFR